jgi:GNAT superfamily N-acetyltransferase
VYFLHQHKQSKGTAIAPVNICPVRTKSDEMRFIKFQWTVYEGSPNWVPPLLMDRKKLIDKRNNPFYKHAVMEMFLAERDGEIVGRIAAIINDNHNKEHEENIGFFGFFECIDDQAVATVLFDEAKKWLKAKGVTAMRGPASPSVNDEYGLLVEGFDLPPAILMCYNPPYYQKLIESYGFTKAKDLYAYYIHRDKALSDKLKRITEIVKNKSGVVFRSIDMKRFDEEAKTLRELYNRGWARNWGEVPMTEEEFAYVAKDLKPIVHPELVLFAEVKGKPVGFALSLPDYNMILKDNKKGYLLPALVRMMLFKKKIDFIRIIILGVLPEYLNSGIGGALFYETGIRSVENGFPHGEASWVLEDNVMMIRGADLMGGDKWKTYRVYDYAL